MSEHASRHSDTPASPRDAKRSKRRLFLILLAIPAAVLIISIVFLCIGSSGSKAAAELKGKWKIDAVTVYEFDGVGSGVMHTAVKDYSFSYKANFGTLSIDYANDAATDRSYSYTLSGSTLFLSSSGAQYTLIRIDG